MTITSKISFAALLAFIPAYAWADPASLMIVVGQFLVVKGVELAIVYAGYALVAAGIIYGTTSKRRAAKKSADAARNAYNNSLGDRGATIISAIPPWRIVYGRATVGASIHAMFTTDKVSEVNGETIIRKDALHYLVYVFAAHECAQLHDVKIDGVSAGPFDANGWSLNSEYRKTESRTTWGEVTLAPGQSHTSDKPFVNYWAQELNALTDYAHGQYPADYSGSIGITNEGKTATNNHATLTLVFSYTFFREAESSFRFLWHAGSDTQVVDPVLHALFPDKWTTNHRIRGRAYAVVMVDIEDPKFQGGPPQLTADVTGKLVYDPRSTLTAGSSNNALCIRDFLLAKWGANASATEVNDTYTAAAANACDVSTAFETLTFNNNISFNFSSSVDGCVGYETTVAWLSTPGRISVETLTPGGYVTKAGMSFSGAINRYVRFQVKRVAGEGWTGKLYYKTASHDYSEDYRKDVSAGFIAGNPPTELLFDMHSLTFGKGDWKDNVITGLRFVFGSEQNDKFEIYSIALGWFYPTTTMQPKYTLNGTFTTDDNREAVLEDMAASMNGFVTNSGSWLIVAGSWTAPVRDFDDNDLDGQISLLQTDTGLEELANSAKGTYYPIGASSPVEFEAYQNSTLVTADGEELWLDFALPFTADESRARNLARGRVERTRSGQILSIPLKLHAWNIQVGDRIRQTSTEYGLSLKAYRITDWGFSLTGAVLVTAQEDTEEGYDEADTTLSDPTPNTNLPNPNVVQTVENLAATSGTSTLTLQSDGTVNARVKVTWAAARDAYLVSGASYVEISWRRTGKDPAYSWRWVRVPATNTSMYLDTVEEFDVLAIGARFINSIGRIGEQSYIDHIVIGKSEPPSAVTGLTGSVSQGLGVLYWDDPADLDYAVTEIRLDGTGWDDATLLFRGKANTYTQQVLTADTYIIRAKHVDTSGNYSVTAASFTLVVDEEDLAGGGSAGLSLQLNSTGFAFVFDDEADTSASYPADIVFTVVLQGISGAVAFSGTAYTAAGAVVGSVGGITFTGTGDTTRTLTAANFNAAGPTTVRYVLVTATLGGLSDTMTVYRGDNGSSVVQAMLTNEAHTLPTTTAGVVTYTGSGTAIRVFEGTMELDYDGVGTAPGKWTASRSVTSGTISSPGALSESGPTAVMADHAGMDTTAAQVTITIDGKTLTGASFPTITKIQSLSKSWQGADGEIGVSAQTMTLTADNLAFIFANAQATTAESPASITFTANLQNLTGTVTFEARAYTAGGTDLGPVTLGGTSPNATMSKAAFVTYAATRYVIVTATIPSTNGSGTLTDKFTVYRGDDGGDALNIVLSNEDHSVPTASDGTGGVFTGATSTVKVYEGITDVTTLWTLTSTVSNCAGTFNGVAMNTAVTGVAAPVIAVTSMSADSATVSIAATRSGYASMTKVMSLSKNKAGIPGSDGTTAQTIELGGSAFAFIFSDVNATAATEPASITFTASLQNVTGTVTFSALAYDSGGGSLGSVSLTGSGVTRSMTKAAFVAPGGTRYAIVTASIPSTNGTGTLTDTFTVYRGDNGSNAITAVLSNDSHTIPTDSAGNNGVYTGSGSTIRVFEGTTELDYDGVGTAAGKWTASRSASGITAGAISESGLTGVMAQHSAMTANTATVTITITGKTASGGSFSLTKLQTLSKSKQGTGGDDGARGSARIYWVQNSDFQRYSNRISPRAKWARLGTLTGTNDTEATQFDSDATAHMLSETGAASLVVGDELTVTNSAQDQSATGWWDGTQWIDPGVVIDGNLLVEGTVTALGLNAVYTLSVMGDAITVPRASTQDIVDTDITATNVTDAQQMISQTFVVPAESSGKDALPNSRLITGCVATIDSGSAGSGTGVMVIERVLVSTRTTVFAIPFYYDSQKGLVVTIPVVDAASLTYSATYTYAIRVYKTSGSGALRIGGASISILGTKGR